jgi:hypothetical protein
MTLVYSASVIPQSTYRVAALVVYLSVDCNDVSTRGKAFRWPRPELCPSCEASRLWGHGYVRRFFDGFDEALWMKRWRCPECGAVHTARPDRFWRGFWAQHSTIIASLFERECERRWLPRPCRQRQQYWWRGFQIQRQFDSVFATLTSLVAESLIIATHSLTHREVRSFAVSPHRIFAYTPALRGP